jgi:hypothetical protein
MRNPSMYKYSDNLTLAEANRLANKLKSDDKKLKKYGGSGNYSAVEVRLTFEGPGKKVYGVFVSPISNPQSNILIIKNPAPWFKIR